MLHLIIFSLVLLSASGEDGGNCGTYNATDGTMYNLTLLTKYDFLPTYLFVLSFIFIYTLLGHQVWDTQSPRGTSAIISICVTTISVGLFVYLSRLVSNTFSAPLTQRYCYNEGPAYQISVTSICFVLGSLPPVIKDGSMYLYLSLTTSSPSSHHICSALSLTHSLLSAYYCCSRWTRGDHNLHKRRG